MSTTAEQIAALRAGLPLAQSAPEQTEPVQDTVKEDELLTRIFELGLFDAIVPAPDGERLYEYEERRKQFNLIMHDFISEQLNAQAQEHEEEVEDLNTRLDNVNNLLDKEIMRSADLQHDYDKLQESFQELKDTYEKSKEEKKYEPPSEPLKNRIASLKQQSADDLVARFNARQAEKNNGVSITTTPDLQFRPETNPLILGSDPVLPAIEIPKVAFPFPTSGSEELPSISDNGKMVPQAVREYVEQRFQEFAAKNNLIA